MLLHFSLKLFGDISFFTEEKIEILWNIFYIDVVSSKKLDIVTMKHLYFRANAVFTVVIEQREKQSSKVGVRSVLHMVDCAGKYSSLLISKLFFWHIWRCFCLLPECLHIFGFITDIQIHVYCVQTCFAFVKYILV